MVQEPKLEQVRDVKLIGSTKVTPGAIDETTYTVECGGDGEVFASIMDLDNDVEGEKYIWLDEGEADVQGERSTSSEKEAIVCRSAFYVMHTGYEERWLSYGGSAGDCLAEGLGEPYNAPLCEVSAEDWLAEGLDGSYNT